MKESILKVLAMANVIYALNIIMLIVSLLTATFYQVRLGFIILGAYSLLLGVLNATLRDRLAFRVRSTQIDSFVLIVVGVGIVGL
ncbi:MAG: DUF3017 domain-containing protein, partial [Bifidobacteriaceae bacterium]|nr:DUF3017 domain-containing protein [Bifidobacteriaceae bacterium]